MLESQCSQHTQTRRPHKLSTRRGSRPCIVHKAVGLRCTTHGWLLKYIVTMVQMHASKQTWQQLRATISVQIHAGGLHNGPTHWAGALLPLMPF